MIILNEKEYAEECLRTHSIGDNPFLTLTILAKYFYHCLNYKKKRICVELTSFLEKYYPRYTVNKLSWGESIDKIAQNARKYKLYEIDCVQITSNEIQIIQSIKNKVLERLAFTLLCLAKLGNLKNPKNNGWVNVGDKEIFSLARITGTIFSRDEKMNSLYQKGLIEFPRKVDNLSCRVKFINDDSEPVLSIDDFRELGYEYQLFCGENFVRCKECGRLIRGNKNNTKKYCKDCAGYIPQETKTVVCVDCGKEFEVNSKNNMSCRCDECYTAYRRNYYKEKKREQRKTAECPQNN